MTATLIYHDIADADGFDDVGFPGSLAARYKHTSDRFDAHLDAIAATGAAVGLIGPETSPPAIALTFDDGGASALEIAARLEARGWRGHFFVTTGRIGTAGFLDEAGVRELALRGHEVGSHSVSHPTYMGRLSRLEIQREWFDSRDCLGAILGSAPTSAAIPGGYGGPVVIGTAADAGFRVLMTSEPRARIDLERGMLVVGRYTIWSTTPPATAAAYARGDRYAQARLRAEWRVKGLLKRASPRIYDAARLVRARRG